ncbi:hypothetical protein P170DRAFT_450491 [Aspergillus steynii IBT 23096]|uniref:Micro-fibrillar-associated protein 1 C-terminal domain-containing protein n=1 Tax=Aspergillus steynii IBT 23096 TaxID=1392250 RepID=A0A2I2FUW3_9EURO|nr:uncharacterized protein P170DRAFT_450491 [Aspergillus steynii IBT 23096]PLB44356.1 hypothetical protein P170DRAFT_450491 [Aspergillus steynii IBT 23096]
MPPPLPSHHRGMTANPVRPGRYRPGKAVAEEPSSEEEEDDDEAEAEAEKARIEERRRQERLRREQAKAPPPKASSFPAGAVTKGVKNVKIQEEDDEEGFVTEEEEEEEEEEGGKVAPRVAGDNVGDASAPSAAAAPVDKVPARKEESSEEGSEEEEEESSEEESSSEDEAPRRVLLRPTFIKKDNRKPAAPAQDGQGPAPTSEAPVDSGADSEARKAQRQEKADMLIRDQLEKDAVARSTANRAWDDDDELEFAEEGAIDDKDGVDPEAEYAAWKLRELKRIKREREAIEASEKEREEIERRRNLTAEEREREDNEFIARQKEDKEANRGQTGFMQRYFHKGAFFRDDLEREGLDQRNVMGARFVDDVSRETLPQYMQIRDMTKLGKKGRTRYRDLKSEDTGRFGEGFNNRRRFEGAPEGITDERFMPDRRDDRPKGPTGANAGPVRERRRSRSRSPRRDRRDRSGDRYRPDDSQRRKRSPSPYDDRDKRRRVGSDS